MAVNQITRDDATALIPVEYSEKIFNGVAQDSIALKLMTRLPNMTAKQLRIPVLETLPIAYWQTADNSKKGTTKSAWKGVFVEAEEIAVIIPISENVLADSAYPIWDMVMPKVVEAFKAKIDQAVFFGQASDSSKPTSFPDGIVRKAIAVGNTITPAGTESFYSLVDNAMYEVEKDGYDVNGIVGGAGLRHLFRGLLDANGQPLLAYTEVSALPRYTMKNGAWDPTVAQFVVGDFSQAVYSIRQDISFKILTEATIDDGAGNSINLAQQDMVALRVVMRLGWALPNPVNRLNDTVDTKSGGTTTLSTRFPFAVVEPVEEDDDEENS